MQIEIQKTATGYILRQNTLQSIGYTCLSVLGMGFGGLFLRQLLLTEGGNTVLYAVCTFFGLGGGLLFLLTQVGHRRVLDDEGVRLYRLFFRMKSLAWEQIWDWGTTTDTSRGRAKNLYYRNTESFLFFSSLNESTLEMNHLCLKISETDYRTLPKTAVWRYIRARARKASKHS